MFNGSEVLWLRVRKSPKKTAAMASPLAVSAIASAGGGPNTTKAKATEPAPKANTKLRNTCIDSVDFC